MTWNFARRSRQLLAIVFLANLAILGFGVWQTIQVSKSETNLPSIQLSELRQANSATFPKFRLTEVNHWRPAFRWAGDDYVQLVQPSTDMQTTNVSHEIPVERTILLRAQPHKMNQIMAGLGSGSLQREICTSHHASERLLEQLADQYPDYPLDKFTVVSFVRSEKQATTWFFAGSSFLTTALLGLIFLALRNRMDQLSLRRDRIRCSVNMEAALSRYDTLRHSC